MTKMDLNLFGEAENQTIEKLDEMKSDWQMNDNNLAVEVAKLTQLTRIADVLEEIGDNLERLANCVAYIPPTPLQNEGYYIFRIGGCIDNGN